MLSSNGHTHVFIFLKLSVAFNMQTIPLSFSSFRFHHSRANGSQTWECLIITRHWLGPSPEFCFSGSEVNSITQSVQSLSHVQLLATPWTAARQASLSITNSQSPPKLIFVELVLDLWICIYEHVPRWYWCLCSWNHTMKTTLHSHGNFFCLYKVPIKLCHYYICIIFFVRLASFRWPLISPHCSVPSFSLHPVLYSFSH